MFRVFFRLKSLFTGSAVLIFLAALILQAPPVIANNNVIELGCDTPGSQYFYVKTRSALDVPVWSYYLQSKNPDVWVATTGTYNGKTLNESLFWPIEMEYSSGDGTATGTNYTLLVNRNIPKDRTINYGAPCSRTTTGCQVSKQFGDHALDWDYLVSKKDSILAAAGLTDSSPIESRVAALVSAIFNWPGSADNHYVHPVDFFYQSAQGANCTGRANAMVAFASILGIPARNYDWYDHSICEIFVNGRWHYCENTPGVVANILNGYEKGPFFILLA